MIFLRIIMFIYDNIEHHVVQHHPFIHRLVHLGPVVH